VRFTDRALKALRFAPPARARLAALTERSANLRHAMIDGQHTVLTRLIQGAILEVTSTVALRATPSASPDAGHTNRRSQITIRALLLDTLLVDRSRDATSANQAIDSDRRRD
jgi:hypothetical protein